MFIKFTKAKQYTYVQLVEGYREGKKVKHRVVVNLGRLDLLQKDGGLEDIASKLAQIAGAKNILDIRDCHVQENYNYGYIVYKKLWKLFKLDKLLSCLQEKGKTEFNLSHTCLLMVINHLLNPRSKLGIHENQSMYAQYQNVDLNHLYRSLDMLSEEKEVIENQMFEMNRETYGMEIDVVFFDVTTFHFESVRKDELRNFGFSKANKINEVQVVLGMMIDKEGRPIGYELFSGNTAEGKTLEPALEKLEKRFGIRRVIIVADRGINSGINLRRIKNRKYGYIIASKIKKLKEEIRNKIFDSEGYQQMNSDIGKVRYKIIDYINEFKVEGEKGKTKLAEKMIITYSENRAKKDRKDRMRLLEKAEYLLENKSQIKSSGKRGGKKYLKEIGKTDWKLDLDALARDEQFDGYYAIQTSEPDLSAENILSAYHSLWKIEESFRVMKSTLEVRPIFHWTERRIQGHFVICFLAFLLERTMEIELRKVGANVSPQKIRDAINAMQFNQFQYNKESYFLRAPLTELGQEILSRFRIKPPALSGHMTNLHLEKMID